jgi:hypothetical protein
VPTVVTRYIDTGSTAGGDGTTNATSGANRAWPNFNHAIGELNTAYSSDLVTADVQIDLISSGAVDDTTALTNALPASNASCYIHWQVPVADRKVPWDANVYTFSRGVGFAPVVTLTTHSIRVTGIQIVHTSNLNVGGQHGLVFLTTGEFVADGVKVGKTQNAGQGAIVGTGSSGLIVLRNCITGLRPLPASSFGWVGGISLTSLPSNTTVLLYNNTVVANNNGGSAFGITIGFTAGGSNKVARVKNNLIQTSNVHAIAITNATTSDTATNHTAAGTDAAFVDVTNGNLRLTNLDTVARNLGTDLSAVADWPFNVDGDLTTRPVGSAWDIGAHEQTTPNTTGRVFVMMMGP